MTFASAQLYLRDIELIRDMPICGNRSDVENWNVTCQKATATRLRRTTRLLSFRFMFISFLLLFICFRYLL